MSNQRDKHTRTVLPIPDRHYTGLVKYDAKFIDGTKVGEGRVPATIPMVFSADETTDVGYESASPVSEEYTNETSKFNGTINWVQIDQGTDDADHLITPEERFRVAMARQ